MTTNERLAMTWAIEELAPTPEVAILGIMLSSAGDHPGVLVHVDWPVFLGRDAAVIDAACAERLAFLRAEDKARIKFAQRSESIRAGLARRKAAGEPVGRQPGATDKQPRRRSGYIRRWERERAVKAS